MSLAALNSPPLVTLAGIGGLLGMPTLERWAADGTLTFASLRAANVVAFAVQLVAVSVPGRIDGQVAEAMAREEEGQRGSRVAERRDGRRGRRGEDGASPNSAGGEGTNYTPRSGRTLLAPAGWAFAIWGPIFMGELAFVGSQALIPKSSPVAPLLKQVSVPFVMAQTFQTLWCAAFRPKYSGVWSYTSAALLSSVAYSLSKAHAAFSASPKPYTTPQYCVLFLPLSMHFAWTTAASLVNVNGSVSKDESNPPWVVAIVGQASAVAATAAGAAVTLARSAPVFGGVIAWALLACADGMGRRLSAAAAQGLERRKKTDDDNGGGDNGDDGVGVVPGLYGASVQRRICLLGAAANLVASLVVAGRLLLHGGGSNHRYAPPRF